MSAIDRSPARLSAGLALLAAFLATVATAALSVLGFLAALVGTVLLASGVLRGRQRGVSLGAAVLLVGVLYAGVVGDAVVPVLVGVVGAALAWDVGSYAIGVGEQLGRAAETARIEVLHAGATLAVGAGVAAIGYAVYLVGGGGQPLSALLGLLVAAIFLTWSMLGEDRRQAG